MIVQNTIIILFYLVEYGFECWLLVEHFGMAKKQEIIFCVYRFIIHSTGISLPHHYVHNEVTFVIYWLID